MVAIDISGLFEMNPPNCQKLILRPSDGRLDLRPQPTAPHRALRLSDANRGILIESWDSNSNRGIHGGSQGKKTIPFLGGEKTI